MVLDTIVIYLQHDSSLCAIFAGGSVTVRSEQSARRNAEEEASLRRAGRWVLATLAVAAAATADDVVMTQLNSKRFTAVRKPLPSCPASSNTNSTLLFCSVLTLL